MHMLGEYVPPTEEEVKDVYGRPVAKMQKVATVLVYTMAEVKELEKAGWTVVTDSECGAGGEV
jgi:hypothetical protein